jgi:hypothetical protein
MLCTLEVDLHSDVTEIVRKDSTCLFGQAFKISLFIIYLEF